MTCPNCSRVDTLPIKQVLVTTAGIEAELTHCPSCDYLYLREPFWLETAYRDEFYGDTGYVARNIYMAKKSLALFRCWKLISRCTSFPASCDIGAGVGMFARMMRDSGYNFFGYDEFTKMPLIKPFLSAHGNYRIKTAFEVIEHLPSLPAFLVSQIGDVDLFLFSTELRRVGDVPDDQWWYYAFNIGQHIGFHSKKSLSIAFSRAGYNHKCLMSYGSSLHALALTKEWRTAFQTCSVIWRIQDRLIRFRRRFNSACFSESSLTSADYSHAMSLITAKTSRDNAGMQP